MPEMLSSVSSLSSYAAWGLHAGIVLVWSRLRAAPGERQDGCWWCLSQGLTGEPKRAFCMVFCFGGYVR